MCFISLVSLHLWALVSLCWCVCNHCQRSRISEILKLHGSMSMQTFVWPCALSGVQVLITHSINFYPKKHFLCLSPTILIFLLFTTVQITFFFFCAVAVTNSSDRNIGLFSEDTHYVWRSCSQRAWTGCELWFDYQPQQIEGRKSNSNTLHSSDLNSLVCIKNKWVKNWI